MANVRKYLRIRDGGMVIWSLLWKHLIVTNFSWLTIIFWVYSCIIMYRVQQQWCLCLSETDSASHVTKSLECSVYWSCWLIYFFLESSITTNMTLLSHVRLSNYLWPGNFCELNQVLWGFIKVRFFLELLKQDWFLLWLFFFQQCIMYQIVPWCTFSRHFSSSRLNCIIVWHQVDGGQLAMVEWILVCRLEHRGAFLAIIIN